MIPFSSPIGVALLHVNKCNAHQKGKILGYALQYCMIQVVPVIIFFQEGLKRHNVSRKHFEWEVVFPLKFVGFIRLCVGRSWIPDVQEWFIAANFIYVFTVCSTTLRKVTENSEKRMTLSFAVVCMWYTTGQTGKDRVLVRQM